MANRLVKAHGVFGNVAVIGGGFGFLAEHLADHPAVTSACTVDNSIDVARHYRRNARPDIPLVMDNALELHRLHRDFPELNCIVSDRLLDVSSESFLRIMTTAIRTFWPDSHVVHLLPDDDEIDGILDLFQDVDQEAKFVKVSDLLPGRHVLER